MVSHLHWHFQIYSQKLQQSVGQSPFSKNSQQKGIYVNIQYCSSILVGENLVPVTYQTLHRTFPGNRFGVSFYKQVFHKYTNLVMLTLLYCHKFAVFFFICFNWC